MMEQSLKENNYKDSLSFPILLVSLSFGIISFLLPVYSKRIEGDALDIGWLFSIFAITTLIVRPLVGQWIDKFGRKYFFVASLFIYALSLILFAFSTNITTLFIARFVQGIGSSFMWISAYAIAADLADSKNRGNFFGKVDETSSKGALYGTFFAFLFLGMYPLTIGWKYLFLIFTGAAIIGGFLALKNFKETLSQNANHIVQKKKPSSALLKIMLIVFIVGFSSSMLSPLLLIYLQDRFTTDIGLLAQAFLPAAIIHSYLPSKMGKYSDKYGRVTLIALGLLGAGIVSIGIPNIPSMLWLVILWTLEAIGLIMASPALKAFVADHSGANSRGISFSYYTLAGSLGAVFGPITGGWLYEHVSHSFPFYLNGIILIIVASLTVFLLKKNSFSKNEEMKIVS